MEAVQGELIPGCRVEGPPRGRALNSNKQRYARFVAAYLANGLNAKEAAITAGYSEQSAYAQGSRLLKMPAIIKALAGEGELAVAKLDYTAKRTLEEIARIAFNDPRRVFRAGAIRSVEDLDEDTARTLASVTFEETAKGGRRVKIKWLDKSSALDKLMRYHALYQVDEEKGEGDFTLVMDV